MRLFLVGALILSFSVLAADEQKVQNGLVIILQEVEPVGEGQMPQLRLIAENRGKETIEIVKPIEHYITQGGVNGWNMTLSGPDGEYVTVPKPAPAIPLTQKNYIKLAPGEGVSALINIDFWRIKGKFERVWNAGKYSARATYAAPEQYSTHVTKADGTVETGSTAAPKHVPVSSEGLTFTRK